jgi:putative salt-induced outer membrane protein YdiY
MIIYDGLLSSYRISFGPGIRRRLNASFKNAKEINGIITSIP